MTKRWHIPRPGETYWFEYHCDPNSVQDRPIYLRSHERVTVLSVLHRGYGRTLAERADGDPCMLRVRFTDGLEWDVFEDELCHDTPLDFCQSIPSSKSLVRVV